jgi:hypothetical protein
MRSLRVQQAIKLCERIKTQRETKVPQSSIDSGRSWASIAVKLLTCVYSVSNFYIHFYPLFIKQQNEFIHAKKDHTYWRKAATLANEKIGAIVVVSKTILMAMTALLSTEHWSIIVLHLATFFCWGAWVSPTVIIQKYEFQCYCAYPWDLPINLASPMLTTLVSCLKILRLTHQNLPSI